VIQMSGYARASAAGVVPALELRAGAMLSAVTNDPQFDMPTRPAFVSGVVVVPLASGLLVDGTGEQKVFRGGAARSLLPRLIPLLDGSRDDRTLAADLGETRLANVQAALALLYASGLLEATRNGIVSTLVPEPVRQFAARHLDSTRTCRDTAEVMERLRHSRIGVFGANDYVRVLMRQLRATGLQCGSAGATSVGQYNLIVGLETTGVGPSLRDLDDACARTGVPWVRFRVLPTGLELGPRFDRRCTACYQCFACRDTEPDVQGEPAASQQQWAAVAAQELFFHVSRVGAAASSRAASYAKIDFAQWTTRRLPFMRRIGCDVCCPTDAKPADRLPVAYAYDQSVAWPPLDLIFPKAHQAHYRIANTLLQGEQRRFQSAPQIPLGRSCGPGPSGARTCPGELSARQLSEILRAAFGIRPAGNDGRGRRAAPTGGNLGSPQAFVALKGVANLPDGVFAYQPFGHSLAVLESQLSGDLASLGIDRIPKDARAAVIVTSMLTRVVRKYGSLAFKLCALDAGVALQQLRMMAQSLDVECVLVHSWDEAALAGRIGAGQPDEPIMGLAVLGGDDLSS
jgi:SagB-type dehydrogenase family enzyme